MSERTTEETRAAQGQLDQCAPQIRSQTNRRGLDSSSVAERNTLQTRLAAQPNRSGSCLDPRQTYVGGCRSLQGAARSSWLARPTPTRGPRSSGVWRRSHDDVSAVTHDRSKRAICGQVNAHSNQNVDTVRRGIEAWNRRDAERWLSYAAPEIEWIPAGPAAVERPVYRGYAVAASAFQSVWQTWEEFRFEESEVRDLDGSVLWLGRVKMRGLPATSG